MAYYRRTHHGCSRGCNCCCHSLLVSLLQYYYCAAAADAATTDTVETAAVG
jgi:hypothetical protein